MTALTRDRDTPQKYGEKVNLPLAAAAHAFTGGMVGINTAGYAVAASADPTLKTVGVCELTVDNTLGGAGAQNVMVDRGAFRFTNSGGGDLITLANLGSPCYVVDDQTVAATSNTNTRPVAGIVIDVDTVGVWVKF